MAKTKLIISGPQETKEVVLEPKGVTLGRHSDCDIVLDHGNISRLHARIFQDPFGRWIVEDLESQNGVLIEDKRIKAQAVLPNQQINIRPFTFTLSQEFERRIFTDTTIQSTATVVDKGLEEEVVSYKTDKASILSAVLIRRLNELTNRLMELQNPSELYSEASYQLATMLDALVVFVRLPAGSDPFIGSPQILACHFGKDAIKDATTQVPNFHFSRRVLEAMRSKHTPVMARSGPSSGKQMLLTIVDETTPHLVFSAPINDFDGTLDVLYLDILEDKAPKEIFDFVEAIARQINSAQKSLYLSEAKAERRILDQQLELAHEIQSKLIPKDLEHKFEVDIAVCYEPAMWVGGDYYDVWPLENGQIAFAVGDVSGKGLPAAMIMSNLQAALRTTITFCSELSTVAKHINQHLCQSLSDDMFVTFFLGLFEPLKNKLTYINAGHVLPLIMLPSEPARILGEATSPPLGIFEGSFSMAEHTIPPQTSLLVVTDGITEAGSPDGQLFEMDRLAKVMTDSKAQSAQELIEAVVKGAADFRETLPPQDDITVLALVNRKTEEKET